jgi:tetratricopeptide (TPR) repeat protein
MFCSLALAAVFLNVTIPNPYYAELFRDLVWLPQWPEYMGVKWTSSGKFYIPGDTPLAQEALAAARRAARANPDDGDAQAELYRLLDQTGDRAGAAAVARKLTALRRAEVAKKPGDWEARAALASALDTDGDHAGACAAARRAVELAPKESGAWLMLATTLAGDQPAEAMRAMDRAVAHAPADDLDTRLWRAFLRAPVRQRLLDQLPAVADPAARGAALAGVNGVMLDIDALLAEAAKRLKAQDGKCGPDTRERCLCLMLVRDALRVAHRSLDTAGVPEVVFTAASGDLVREIIPPASDDAVRLGAAALFVFLATPGALSDDGAELAKARAAAAPYLRRLDELSNAKPTARAATAALLRGFAEAIRKNPEATGVYCRRAVGLVPTFDLAWGGLLHATWSADESHKAAQGALLGTACTADKIRVRSLARECAAKSGTAYSWYSLAYAQGNADDWPAAERTVAAALAKHPDSPRLLMARAACRLRRAETGADFRAVLRDLAAARARLGPPGCGAAEVRKEYCRLVALAAARFGDLKAGRPYLDEFAAHAKGKEDRADATSLSALYVALDASPLLPLRSTGDEAKACRRLFNTLVKPRSKTATQDHR